MKSKAALIITVLFCIILLSACSSTKKDEQNTSEYKQTTGEQSEKNNETKNQLFPEGTTVISNKLYELNYKDVITKLKKVSTK